MKKSTLYAAVFIIILNITPTQNIHAQDNWIQGKTGIYSVGIGGTQVIEVGNTGPFAYSSYYAITRTANTGLSLNFSGEYKVWNWIGAGFITGIDFDWYHYPGYIGLYGTHYGGAESSAFIGFPVIGGKVNAHIMDAFGLAIANKLDVYAGINLGGFPMFYTGPGGGVDGAIFVGPQVGARYWVTGNVGVFAEFGWGATFANIGATF